VKPLTDRDYLTMLLLVALLMVVLALLSTPFRQRTAPDPKTDFRQIYTR